MPHPPRVLRFSLSLRVIVHRPLAKHVVCAAFLEATRIDLNSSMAKQDCLARSRVPSCVAFNAGAGGLAAINCCRHMCRPGLFIISTFYLIYIMRYQPPVATTYDREKDLCFTMCWPYSHCGHRFAKACNAILLDAFSSRKRSIVALLVIVFLQTEEHLVRARSLGGQGSNQRAFKLSNGCRHWSNQQTWSLPGGSQRRRCSAGREGETCSR